ncbi:hypothetical protein [Escherichia coli]|uniref:hypothetical protein n=1 Tax=Escherichia coli TaxID=562 RepID=UPI0013154D96|nr:hypothetical protein [Escherichia coli]
MYANAQISVFPDIVRTGSEVHFAVSRYRIGTGSVPIRYVEGHSSTVLTGSKWTTDPLHLVCSSVLECICEIRRWNRIIAVSCTMMPIECNALYDEYFMAVPLLSECSSWCQ